MPLGWDCLPSKLAGEKSVICVSCSLLWWWWSAPDVGGVASSLPVFAFILRHCLLGTFRVENQCCFEAILKIVFELVLGAWGTPKTIFSFDLPRFGAFSSHF